MQISELIEHLRKCPAGAAVRLYIGDEASGDLTSVDTSESSLDAGGYVELRASDNDAEE